MNNSCCTPTISSTAIQPCSFERDNFARYLMNASYGITSTGAENHTDQPWDLAILRNFNKDINYCPIEFTKKPENVSFEQALSSTSFVGKITLQMPFGIDYHIHINDVVALVKSDSSGYEKYSNIKFFRITGMNRCCTLSLDERYIHLIVIEDASIPEHFKENVKASYNRHINKPTYEPIKDIGIIKADELTSTNVIAKKLLNVVIGSLWKDKDMMASIDRVIINEPAVIIFWSDGDKTISKCMERDTFNPETGLAMCIAKKYFKCCGEEHPRGALKRYVKKADNQTAKTKDKKEKKNSEKTAQSITIDVEVETVENEANKD